MARRYLLTETDKIITSSDYSPSGTDAVNGQAITAAINTLNKEDTEEEGKYVSSVSESNGIINVIKNTLPSHTDDDIKKPQNATEGQILSFDGSDWIAKDVPTIDDDILDNQDCYKITDEPSEVIDDADYIPLSDTDGNKKKSLLSSLITKILNAMPLQFRNNEGVAQYSLDKGVTWKNFRNPVGNAGEYQVLSGYTFANSTSDSLSGKLGKQTKTVTPTSSAQYIYPDENFLLSRVTVSAVSTQTKSATPSTSSQTITPDDGKYLSSVTVGAISTETKTVTSGTTSATVNPTSGKYISKITVNPVTLSQTISASGNVISSTATMSNGGTSTKTYTLTNQAAKTYYGNVGANTNPTLFKAGSYVYFAGDYKLGSTTSINNIVCSSGTPYTKSVYKDFSASENWILYRVYVYPYSGTLTAVGITVGGLKVRKLTDVIDSTAVGKTYTAVNSNYSFKYSDLEVSISEENYGQAEVEIQCSGAKCYCICIWSR